MISFVPISEVVEDSALDRANRRCTKLALIGAPSGISREPCDLYVYCGDGAVMTVRNVRIWEVTEILNELNKEGSGDTCGVIHVWNREKLEQFGAVYFQKIHESGDVLIDYGTSLFIDPPDTLTGGPRWGSCVYVIGENQEREFHKAMSHRFETYRIT